MESDNTNLQLKAILDELLAGRITESDARGRMAGLGIPDALTDEILGEVQSDGDVIE